VAGLDVGRWQVYAQGFTANGDLVVWEKMRRGGVDIDAGRELAGLYEEHSGPVFAFGLHLCGSRADAEDLVQIAFLHAHQALLRGERLVNPRAWLITVVKRQAFNRWRDRREIPSSASMPEASPVDDGNAVDELARVRLLLYSLPEAQHQAFVLRHWSGLSNREIAGVLDTSESAVESLLVRARAAIVASGPAEEECFALRRRLTDNRELTPAQSSHVARCKGCARAHQRLTRAAAAVVVLGLVPRAHVAQALAAAVPGFAGTAGAGAGAASGAGLAAKVTGTKTAIAAVGSLLAVAAAAPVALHVAHHLPTTSHRASAPATIHRSIVQAQRSAAPAGSAQAQGGAVHPEPAERSPQKLRTGRHSARRQAAGAGEVQGDSASGAGQGATASSDGDSQGSSSAGATASDPQGQDTGGGATSGSSGDGSSQGGGSSNGQ
jgi:RNA polymerase sigma-70 factor, ECF subfamily